jgi:ABC-type Zn uptake system ZnuABC Zn-binding protein ZnuA
VRRHRRPHHRLLALAALAVVVAACGTGGPGASPDGSGASSSGGIKVVATTTVLADLVRNVAGDRATVTSLIPSGVGPEDYEPRPDDARQLADADLIVSNGVGLDDFVDKLLTAAGGDATQRIVLAEGIPPIVVDGEPNPHLWLDPSLVADDYIPKIVAALTQADPAAAAAYAASGEAYVSAVRALDEANKGKVATIPAANRKLVTFHDAFPYFAAHYGFELVGVILPNVGQEPSPSALAALVETVKEAGVSAVFSEAQFNPELAQTLAQEAGITKVVSTLYTDSVGPPPNDTYLSMMSWNVDRVVEALS